MSERATPETDAAIDADGKYLHGEIVGGAPDEIMYVPSDFARRLERERDALADALLELVRIEDGPGMGVIGWSAAFDNARALLAELDK